ncbi:hypothetical protein LIER_01889 [Lithospermum erythrorhizon]|uniref:Transposase n=1 Tax=Lithospermum erythrorhizon TaxID=34254 RepID=A0AAV3NMK5_LITER
MIPSTTFVYELEVGDSGLETDSETEVVPVKCPVLMLEYVHDQGDGDVGGVVGPGENLEGLVGPDRDVDRVVGPGEHLDGVMRHGDDLDGVNAHGEDELDGGMDPPMDDLDLVIESIDDLGQGSQSNEHIVHDLITRPNDKDKRNKKDKELMHDSPRKQHKEVRFTQGTTVEEPVLEVDFDFTRHQEGEVVSDLDSVPELDDDGNLRRPEIDEEILYGKELDNFDNDELEQEVVAEGQRLQEEADMQDLEDMDMPPNSQNNEGTPSTPWYTSRRTRKGKKNKIPGTYARFDREINEQMKGKKIVESSDDSASDDDILDDHEGESDLESISGSSDDDTAKQKTVRFNEFDIQNPNLKKPLRRYVNDSKRLKFKCKYPRKWSIWVSKSRRLGLNDFMIKTMSTRHKNCRQTRISLGGSSFFAEAFEELFEVCPDIKIPSLQVAIKKKFSLKISKDIARRAKDKARSKLSKLEGDHIGQCGQLWDYSHELKRTHPGSTIIIYYEKGFGMNNENRFKRMYVGLRALIEGFKIGCRRLIGLDGCHTKGMYKQQILSVVGLDSNNGLWPIAWAVVE